MRASVRAMPLFWRSVNLTGNQTLLRLVERLVIGFVLLAVRLGSLALDRLVLLCHVASPSRAVRRVRLAVRLADNVFCGAVRHLAGDCLSGVRFRRHTAYAGFRSWGFVGYNEREGGSPLYNWRLGSRLLLFHSEVGAVFQQEPQTFWRSVNLTGNQTREVFA